MDPISDAFYALEDRPPAPRMVPCGQRAAGGIGALVVAFGVVARASGLSYRERLAGRAGGRGVPCFGAREEASGTLAVRQAGGLRYGWGARAAVLRWETAAHAGGDTMVEKALHLVPKLAGGSRRLGPDAGAEFTHSETVADAGGEARGEKALHFVPKLAGGSRCLGPDAGAGFTRSETAVHAGREARGERALHFVPKFGGAVRRSFGSEGCGGARRIAESVHFFPKVSRFDHLRAENRASAFHKSHKSGRAGSRRVVCDDTARLPGFS